MHRPTAFADDQHGVEMNIPLNPITKLAMIWAMGNHTPELMPDEHSYILESPRLRRMRSSICSSRFRSS